MVENPNRVVKKLSWDKFEIMTQSLATIIKSEFPEIKYIYGVPRGGLCIAVRLSHILGLNMIYAEDDIDIWEKNRIIIVDDISDSGSTLYDIYNSGREGIQSACLFEREGTIFKPDIVIEKIKEEWIEFPWEAK